eukprot:6186891-Pleurochrysis_carterae.AAC.1
MADNKGQRSADRGMLTGGSEHPIGSTLSVWHQHRAVSRAQRGTLSRGNCKIVLQICYPGGESVPLGPWSSPEDHPSKNRTRCTAASKIISHALVEGGLADD